MIAYNQIQAVTLDVGGTLMEPWPSVGHVYAEVAGKHGVKHPGAARLDGQFSAAWKQRKDFDYTQDAWFGLVKQTFGDVAPSLPEAYFPAVYDRFAQADVWKVYEDVVPVLEELAARGIALGIVSNWDERLHPLLNVLKLRSYFDAVIVSCEVGFTKPSPVIFEQAMRKLGLPGNAILHVGDSHSEDVEGAHAAGVEALHLNRKGRKADGVIGSLKELETLLA